MAEPEEWLPPVPTARYFCLGHNYIGHSRETGAKTPEHPAIFLRHASRAAAMASAGRYADSEIEGVDRLENTVRAREPFPDAIIQ
jgi:2-keto-4-pentenoate hydratase/2-oxohepta-3-ene-1,7-dioic acid hydratase in catechol pathway